MSDFVCRDCARWIGRGVERNEQIGADGKGICLAHGPRSRMGPDERCAYFFRYVTGPALAAPEAST